MASGSLFTVIVLFVAVLAIAGAGFYFYSRGHGGDGAGFFAPRMRRLAFIERAYLDGGRKLLLVRRDDVEHLILIGGPIDLVVETGIQPEAYPAAVAAKEEPSYTDAAARQRHEASLTLGKALEPAGPQHSLPQGGKKNESDMLELTPFQEAKAAQ
jgi:Flagellar biosynthesis protein, FliO